MRRMKVMRTSRESRPTTVTRKMMKGRREVKKVFWGVVTGRGPFMKVSSKSEKAKNCLEIKEIRNEDG